MRFEELERQAADDLRRSTSEVTVPRLLAGRRLARRRLAVAGGAAAAIVAAIGIVALAGGGATPDPAAGGSSSTSIDPAPTTTSSNIAPTAQPSIVWSVEQPPGWLRTDRFASGSITVTMATMNAEGRSAVECSDPARTPVAAVGANDVVLSVTLAEEAGTLPVWPGAELDPRLLESELEPDGSGCLGPVAERIRVGTWAVGGQRIDLLAITTEEGDTALDDLLWETARSLRPEPTSAGTPGCVVTRPTAAGHTPPDTHPRLPVDPASRWYGTDALFTPLALDASHAPRKSVWWSTAFPGGGIEERPPISVVARRLDAEVPPITHRGPGTNATTPEEGWFMLAGIFDPEEPGCWSVTATYKGASLNYVYVND